MFESQSAERAICEAYIRDGQYELVDAIRNELFWNLKVAMKGLRSLGFELNSKRFSELSWGVVAHKP